MATTAQHAFRVDNLVLIGLSALNQEQRHTVEIAILDRDHFLKSIADKSKVRKISRADSIYGLSLGNGLLLIYRVSGENIEVLDIMNQALLERYGREEKLAPFSASNSQLI